MSQQQPLEPAPFAFNDILDSVGSMSVSTTVKWSAWGLGPPPPEFVTRLCTSARHTVASMTIELPFTDEFEEHNLPAPQTVES